MIDTEIDKLQESEVSLSLRQVETIDEFAGKSGQDLLNLSRDYGTFPRSYSTLVNRLWNSYQKTTELLSGLLTIHLIKNVPGRE